MLLTSTPLHEMVRQILQDYHPSKSLVALRANQGTTGTSSIFHPDIAESAIKYRNSENVGFQLGSAPFSW
jgi:hypothetical protein